MVIRLNIRSLGLERSVLYYRRVKRGMNRSLERGLQRSSNVLKREMTKLAPIASGKLKASIEARKSGRFSFTIGARADHARWVQAGRLAGSTPPPLRGRRFRQWLQLKGIPKRKWWAVARAIGRRGIRTALWSAHCGSQGWPRS